MTRTMPPTLAHRCKRTNRKYLASPISSFGILSSLPIIGFGSRSSDFLSLRLEQFHLRIFQQIIILQNTDDLEQVGLLIVAIGLSLARQVRQHRAERNHRINALRTQQSNALL